MEFKVNGFSRPITFNSWNQFFYFFSLVIINLYVRVFAWNDVFSHFDIFFVSHQAEFTPPSEEKSSTPPSENSSISAGTIVGIVAGAVVTIFLILVILWWKGCLRWESTLEQGILNAINFLLVILSSLIYLHIFYCIQ